MTTEAAFLSDICDRPEDDTPRLVYADWLDEHGRPERAELIRVQCELAKLPEDGPSRDDLEEREARLLWEHGERWREDLPEGAREGLEDEDERPFRRGFVETVEIT